MKLPKIYNSVNYKNYKRQLLCLCALLTLSGLHAQQDPQYSQYMYNMSVFNPAYAGSKEAISGGLLYRKQWVDIQGAPSTGTFFLHSPIANNVGLGISFINDRIGPVEENNIYADFSYTLNLGGNHKLAFGLKGGMTLHKIDYNTIIPTLPDVNDGAFSGSNAAESFFNLGTGAFYYTDNYYVAFSVPNFLKANYLDFNGTQYGSENLHYFLTGGYVFDLSPTWKFKPFAMVKSAFNAPTSFDVSTNFLYNDVLEFGATYRRSDSFGAMVNFAITPSLRIGYAYDQIVSDINFASPSSHEIMLLFDLNLSKKVSRSPRFF
jgi:type IX secretion system PorP/SprF family membrane protein